MAGDRAIQSGQTLRYRVCRAQTPHELAQVLAFRARIFRADGTSDKDRFDPLCQHFMVQDQETGALVCVYRISVFPDAATIGQSYAAQFYDLTRLAAFDGAVLELGRFCMLQEQADPDILRLAWGAIAAEVDRHKVGLLFGCSSFRGADPRSHRSGLAALNRYLAPDQWAPQARSKRSVGFPTDATASDARDLPPLLRTYLQMGGWVSDHAVIDDDLDTLHVFTGVEIAKVPPARAKVLRMIAAQIA